MQPTFPNNNQTMKKPFANVGENWKLYDTVLISRDAVEKLTFNQGFFINYAALGLATTIPFFNVRNRNVGLAYNNQDTRDQLPYVFKIFSLGVAFWGPATVTYTESAGAPLAPQTVANHLFETELPKHCSVKLTTNQDERLLTTALFTPPGYGPVTGGLAQGDPENVYTYPNVSHASFVQGVPQWGNVWGFPEPLEIPRLANLAVELEFNEYARQLLQTMIGPGRQFMLDVADDQSYYFPYAVAGIQVTLQGQRFVQQRGQYHA